LVDFYKKYLDWTLAEIFPKDKPFYVHCKTGGRSTIACSILSKAGYTEVINILGGYDGMKAQNKHLKFVE
jgi:rhodanese-related sulfurtransferase